MLINDSNLDTFKFVARASYDAGYSEALAGAVWNRYAEKVTIGTERLEAGWLGMFPQMIESEPGASTIYKAMEAYGYSITPRKFKVGVSFTKEQLEDAADDPAVAAMNLGLDRIMRNAGLEAGQFYGRLCAEGLANGHLSAVNGRDITCFDGQPMFDAAHPNGSQATFANEDTSGGVTNPYFLIDERRKPLILVERKAPSVEFAGMGSGDLAFDNGIWRVKVESRAEIGYALPQFAFRSTATPSLVNYRAHVNTMKGYVSDQGHKMQMRPRLVITGDENEFALVDVFQKPTLATGETNMGTLSSVEVLYDPFLD